MANVKITELTAATALTGTDVLPIVDVGADATKKVSVSDLLRNLPDGTAAAPALAFADDQNTGVLSPAENELAFATTGTQRLVIDSSGRVGIGTNSPAYALSVAATGTSTVQVLSGGNTNLSRIMFGDSDAAGPGYIWYGHSDNSLQFGANSNERMRIDSSGNVGIGTTSPGGTLHVDASGGATVRVSRISSNASKYGQLEHDGTNTTLTSTDNLLFNANSSERMRINSSGNVAIGHSSPSHRLDVKSASAGQYFINGKNSAGTDIFQVYESSVGDGRNGMLYLYNGAGTNDVKLSTNGASFFNAGNVGIGTTSPGFKLHCVEDGSFAGICASSNVTADALASRFALGNSVGTARFTVNMKGGSNELAYLGSEGNFPFYFQTNGAERMRLDASGRLLVGMSSALSGGNSQYALIQTLGNTAGATGNARVVIGRGEAATSMSSGDSIGEVNFTDNTSAEFAQIQAFVDGTPGSNDYPGRLVFSTTADGASGPTERMRISASGQIKATCDGGLLAYRPTATTTAVLIAGYSNVTGTEVAQFIVRTNGDVESRTNSYAAISDLKLKENIYDASSQWEDIKGVRVRNFNLIGDNTQPQIGVIAQEIELVSPGLVTESPDFDENGNDLGTATKSVKYSVLYMKAVKALQEAMDRIETLEAKVAALEAQ
jgi:hypothetical protein